MSTEPEEEPPRRTLEPGRAAAVIGSWMAMGAGPMRDFEMPKPRGGAGSQAKWAGTPRREGRAFRRCPVTGMKLRAEE